MVFTHAFAGAIVGKFLINKKIKNTGNISDTEKTLIYFLTIFGSIFPDLDLISNFFDTTIKHRYLLTHSFLTYTFILILVLVFFRKYKFNFFAYYYGVISHLILDFFAGGLAALAPITYKSFGIPIYFTVMDRINFARTYVGSNYMYAEIIIFFAYFFYVFSKETNKMAKNLPFFFFFISVVMLGALAML